MRPDYPRWLSEQQYSENAQRSRISEVRKVEEHYGSLDEHFLNGTYQEVIDSLEYSKHDERANKPNPSKITINGKIRDGLSSYKSAAVLYRKFLNDNTFQGGPVEAIEARESGEIFSEAEETRQRLSLERDMQAALRRNIASLDPALKIIDDGAERAVSSGLIDITCEDGNSFVVVELKAGKADSRAIGQILGYMGDLQEEEGGKPVRGILVAHDFDQRARSAARVVPTLTLKKYAIEFKFTDEG